MCIGLPRGCSELCCATRVSHNASLMGWLVTYNLVWLLLVVMMCNRVGQRGMATSHDKVCNLPTHHQTHPLYTPGILFFIWVVVDVDPHWYHGVGLACKRNIHWGCNGYVLQPCIPGVHRWYWEDCQAWAWAAYKGLSHNILPLDDTRATGWLNCCFHVCIHDCIYLQGTCGNVPCVIEQPCDTTTKVFVLILRCCWFYCTKQPLLPWCVPIVRGYALLHVLTSAWAWRDRKAALFMLLGGGAVAGWPYTMDRQVKEISLRRLPSSSMHRWGSRKRKISTCATSTVQQFARTHGLPSKKRIIGHDKRPSPTG